MNLFVPASSHALKIGLPIGVAVSALLLSVSFSVQPAEAATNKPLPPLPPNLPSWLSDKGANHVFYKRGSFNFDIYNLPTLARDLNAVAAGHAFAYEDLVTGHADRLESATYTRISKVLDNPPRLMPDEAALSPSFARKYGVLQQVFDWTHVLHNQTIDVLASTRLSESEKTRQIETLWKFYASKPWAITGLPMNMAWLDGQSYSGAFRHKYPKVNGLFWGYHWLQGAMYDALWQATPRGQQMSWEVLRPRYHQVELHNTRRPFMPMFAETSPRFAARFPNIANAFDNLHMLHDMANDIFASDGLTEQQKSEQITRALWLVSASAHQNEKPGDNGGNEHDHRYFEGMAGMGMMKNMTPEAMWMPTAGWMNMSECHHCSMGMEDDKASAVSAQGWTMRVRCPLCARDMSTETKGSSILKLATENPEQVITVISDENGAMKTDTPNAVFLEEVASHAKCDQWSLAFTDRAAFEKWVEQNPKYKGKEPLTFEQWSNRDSAGTPDTYYKIDGPDNPYLEVTQ